MSCEQNDCKDDPRLSDQLARSPNAADGLILPFPIDMVMSTTTNIGSIGRANHDFPVLLMTLLLWCGLKLQ